MQASEFVLKPGQRVTTRNGREWIVVVTSKNTRDDVLNGLLFVDAVDSGFMPARMRFTDDGAWDVVRVYDEPGYPGWLLKQSEKGLLLWTEESQAVAQARSDVTRLSREFNQAQERLTALLKAERA